jgi:hypothetical protein
MSIDASIQAAYNSLLGSLGQERADSYLASMQPYMQSAQSAPAPAAATPAYFQQNPDVAAAFQQNSYGLTPEQFAATHYQKYGVNDQRSAPSPVSDQAVTSWLQSNPGASDATIAAAMQQYGVDPAQMARVTGLGQDVVQSRYNAALPSTTAAQTPLTVEQLYQQYTGRAADPGGLQYWTQQFGSTIDPNEIGIFQNAITAARAQGTEPATTAAPNYEQLVRDAYGSIGRTGIGTAASNIDQAGFNNWVNALQSGSIKPEDLTNTFRSSVADYLTANPQDQYSTYVTNYLAQTKPAAVSGIVDLYRDVLGRDPDAAGLGNWYRLFGEEISPEERAQFERSAAEEKYGKDKKAIADLYFDALGRAPDEEGFDYLYRQFCSVISPDELAIFRTAAHQEKTDPLIYAYEYGIENNDFSGLAALLKQTPDTKALIAEYGLTPEQIDRIEFGTGIDLDQSGGFGYGKSGNDWNYNKYLDELRKGNTDSALNLYKSVDPMGAKRLENMYQELLRQQTVTGDSWATGKLGSKEAAAMDFALRLMENQIDSIYDLGQRTVERVVDGYNGPEVTQDVEYFNKKTGEALPDWDRVARSGPLDLQYRINFTEDGTPIPYTQKEASDWVQFREGTLKPAVSLIAMANPALAPYVAAGNALNAASKGDWGSAIVSGLTAAVGFKGDLGLSASTVETLNKAKTGAQVLNAIDKGNPVALANALMQTDTGKELMGQDMGGGIKLGDVVNTAKVAQLVNTGNYAEALATVGQMTNSPNLKLSASAVNLAQAFQTGDPFKIISAVGQLDRAVKSADAAAKKSEAEALKSAGLEEEVNLPSGIQLASSDGELPFRTEVGGPPIFAEDPRAANIRPPAGYRVLSMSEQQDRLVSEGVGDSPSKY